MQIGEYIKHRRKLLGYTQQQLADCVSVSKQAVNKWEKCLSAPDIMILPALAIALKKSPHFLAEIIWRSNYEGNLTHLISLSVVEKNGESYVIWVFEPKGFPEASELFREILASDNGDVPKYIVEFYAADRARTFRISLEEYEYSALEDADGDGFLIDSQDITSVVKAYFDRHKTEN